MMKVLIFFCCFALFYKILDDIHVRCTLKKNTRYSKSATLQGHLQHAFNISKQYFKVDALSLHDFKTSVEERLLSKFNFSFKAVSFITNSVQLFTFKGHSIQRRSVLRTTDINGWSSNEQNRINGYEWVKIKFVAAKGDDPKWYARVLLLLRCESNGLDGKDLCVVHNLHVPVGEANTLFPHKKFQLAEAGGFDVVELTDIKKQVTMVPVPVHKSKPNSYRQFYLCKNLMF